MKVECDYCGLPFQVRRVEPGRRFYCCSGCAVLGRVPVDSSGNYPVNSHLVAALGVAFLYFNQCLASLVALLFSKQEKLQVAERFWWIAAILAVLVWLGVVIVQRREGAVRGKDPLFASLALVLLVTALVDWPPNGALMAAANGILLVWSVRGLLRLGRKRRAVP